MRFFAVAGRCMCIASDYVIEEGQCYVQTDISFFFLIKSGDVGFKTR